MEFALKKFFGYSMFRPYQKEIVASILDGRDCLVIMATGSGKSLCYQIPPLIVKKTALVVSPLISLMQDQVMALKQRGIKAEYLTSTQTDASVYSSAQSGRFSILYTTPERACSLPTSFWTTLLKAGICLLAVDEAHCISQWGHDFRVEYKQLNKLRDILLNVPYVGLTATATSKVQIDIIKSLNMNDPHITLGSFDRKNLFYGVKNCHRGLASADEFVGEISKFAASTGSIIIYCTTINDVKQVFKSLQDAGIAAGIYHGQMDKKAREESHRLFIRDELQVMVATIAFGMGIDKPDIRYVLHYGCPKSLESYYQESGRCGRDGIASICWLYYSKSDFAKAEFYCGEASGDRRQAIMESLMAAQQFCLTTTCRRKFLLEHFGERFQSDKCGNCDNCISTRPEHEMSREAHLLIACIQSCGGKWGLNMPVDVLRGSRAKKILDARFNKLPLHGLGKEFSSNWWKALAHQLISYGYLTETMEDIYRTVSVSSKGLRFISSFRHDHQPSLVLPLTNEMIDDEEYKSASQNVAGNRKMTNLEHEGLSKSEEQLYLLLLEERRKLAIAADTAPYAICGDQTLKRIALTRPSTKARLANIDGVNQHLVTVYGDHIIQNITSLSKSVGLSLDGTATLQTSNSRNVDLVSTPQRAKLTPAKLDAWKMWHEGLTVKQIASSPRRSAPIKEQTVMEYILDAAKEGLAIDWARFFYETGMTQEMSSEIEKAITKVGSTDRIKPIKNELPEHVAYGHIRTYLAMRSGQISAGVIPLSCPSFWEADELPSKASESSLSSSIDTCRKKGLWEVERAVNNMLVDCCEEPNEATISVHHALDTFSKLPQDASGVSPSMKRQKVGPLDKSISSTMGATENSLLEWLSTHDDGVPDRKSVV